MELLKLLGLFICYVIMGFIFWLSIMEKAPFLYYIWHVAFWTCRKLDSERLFNATGNVFFV